MKNFTFFSLIAIVAIALFTINTTPVLAQATAPAVTAVAVNLDSLETAIKETINVGNKPEFKTLDVFYSNKYPGLRQWLVTIIHQEAVSMPRKFKNSVIHRVDDRLIKVDTTMEKIVMPAVSNVITLAKANALVTATMVQRDSTLARELYFAEPKPEVAPKPTGAQSAWKTLQEFLK